MDDENERLEEDFYQFLNLPRDAPQEEITNAYRRLSRIYHPDKHTDPLRKKEAEVLFNKTKRAYEVLSDPHKRAIYDSLGTKGLETEGWEIVQRTKTPQEIREEYELLAQQKEERRLLQRTNPQSSITVNIDATELFSSYEDAYDDEFGPPGDFFPSIVVKGMNFSQSIQAPLTLTDTAYLSGELSTHKGSGSGSVNVSLRRITSPDGWAEVDLGFGNGLSFSAKGFRNLTKRMFTNISGILTTTDEGLSFGFVSTLAHQLDKNTVGYLTYKNSQSSSMSTSIVKETTTYRTQVNFVLGIPHSFISMSYCHKLEKHEGRLRATVKAGTFGAMLEYGLQRKVSQHSSLAVSMTVGVPTGVRLKIKLLRGNQIYAFPIHLCHEVLPSPIFYGTVTPMIAWIIVRRLVVEPYMQQQKVKDIERHRAMHHAQMLARRREAEISIDLMKETFRRNVEDEENKKGLIITKSIYGRWLDLSHRDLGDAITDVTIPLQCLVRDSKLILQEASKCQLPGFYDPCMGEDKSLYVQYSFHGVPHEVTIQDTDPLRIPKQSHRKQL
ncbi:dnaJ homolog subfamily C member 11-like [Daphnia pulex]|uniref:dnaJ homolog subfamily C member 11-like n=1 Tax=Daphnia pulex TaxID=6669 RepID=UPI001EE1042A|nr:dnaJ homolog subfamily C member 11-like [Daphnia pulex]XP_046636570.1 dnaJ homolog subfamily C member 11-like [Daphnia pulicaria]